MEAGDSEKEGVLFIRRDAFPSLEHFFQVNLADSNDQADFPLDSRLKNDLSRE